VLTFCLASGAPPAASPPGHPSRAAWARAVGARRAAAPGGRLFLDDLLEAAAPAGGCEAPTAAGGASPTVRSPRSGRARVGGGSGSGGAAGYPWASPAAAVEALYGPGIDGAAAGAGDAARRARLALLLYFLVDGGWAGSCPAGDDGGPTPPVAPAAFARALALPPGLATQWEAEQLLDRAAGAPGGARDAALGRAVDRLLGCAHAGTPFRVVEALAAAGRPAAALAVQRARGGGSGNAGVLHEGRVLLAARLAVGLLQEAHAGIAAHCAQVGACGGRGAGARAWPCTGAALVGRAKAKGGNLAECGSQRMPWRLPAHARPWPQLWTHTRGAARSFQPPPKRLPIAPLPVTHTTPRHTTPHHTTPRHTTPHHTSSGRGPA
jgi:hypothetical protein